MNKIEVLELIGEVLLGLDNPQLDAADIKAAISRVPLELHPTQPTTPKPRCDAQGRLIEAPDSTNTYYMVDSTGCFPVVIGEMVVPSRHKELSIGSLFISEPAAEAELTRLKCLQRLRGMEGFTYETTRSYLTYGGARFDTWHSLAAAEAAITPEERAAFLYREPTKE